MQLPRGISWDLQSAAELQNCGGIKFLSLCCRFQNLPDIRQDWDLPIFQRRRSLLPATVPTINCTIASEGYTVRQHRTLKLSARHKILWIQSGPIRSRGKRGKLPLESGIRRRRRHPSARMVLQALGGGRDVREREIANPALMLMAIQSRDLPLRQWKEGE